MRGALAPCPAAQAAAACGFGGSSSQRRCDGCCPQAKTACSLVVTVPGVPTLNCLLLPPAQPCPALPGTLPYSRDPLMLSHACIFRPPTRLRAVWGALEMAAVRMESAGNFDEVSDLAAEVLHQMQENIDR